MRASVLQQGQKLKHETICFDDNWRQTRFINFFNRVKIPFNFVRQTAFSKRYADLLISILSLIYLVVDVNKPVTLIKSMRKLAVGEVLIEIISKNGKLKVAAYEETKSEAYVTEIPEDKAQQIMKLFHGNYASLLNCIDIIGGRLIITKPKVIFT